MVLDIPTKWKGCREGEYRAIKKFVDARVPVLHVQGPHGSGKTSLLRDVLVDKHHVFIDGNLSTSLSALMTCVIRRLARYKRSEGTTSPAVEMSDDDIGDVTSVKSFKKEESTPEGSPVSQSCPSKDKLISESHVRLMRGAALQALKAIAKPGSTTLKRTRKVDSDDEDFLGGDSSDEDDVSDNEVRHPVVSMSQFRVRNVSGFLHKLERLLLRQTDISEPFYIVIDNMDGVARTDEARESLIGFLTLFTHLSEYISIGREICAIFTGANLLPTALAGGTATVHLHPYTLAECQAIIAREGGGSTESVVEKYTKMAILVLYPSMRNNFRLLRDSVISMVTEEAVGLIGSTVHVVAKSDAVSVLSNRFNDENSHRVPSVKWLSQVAKRVLVAGYLAAHNPASQDRHIFKVVVGGRSSRREVTAFKTARTMADSIDIRSPVSFPIQRLLSIYRFLTGDPLEEAQFDGGFEFYRTVNELVHFGLFRGGDGDALIRLGSGARLNCHAPWELIQQVAVMIDVRLDEVLYA
jgi:hypothetical protein